MTKKPSKIKESAIKSLKGADRVRLRPGVIFGSDNIKGAFHTFKEILGNSLDEARGGYGKNILVIYHKDGSISVRDYGRGVPMGWNADEGRYNWDLVFNELYAGGKYDEEDETYKFSVGLNGLGAAAVQYVSEYFIVKSYQGDVMYWKEFKEGNPLDDKLYEEKLDTEEYGTYIKWKIDNKVFRNTNFKFAAFKEYCEGQAHINSVNFKLIDESTGEEVEYRGQGIEHYLKELVGENLIEVMYRKKNGAGKDERDIDYTTECEVALAITEECEHKQLYFHNTATITEGFHLTAVQDAISGFFKALGKQNGVTIMPYDYNDYMSIIVSSYSNITSFANQTKDGVDNKFIYDIVYNTVKDLLAEEAAKGKESIKTLMDNVINTALARKKAKELEAQEKEFRKTAKKKTKAEKYVDCKSNNPAEKELFIVEGDSALGSCKNARDSGFQALLPVRGKTLNCLKAALDKVAENKVIKDIIATVGTGVDLGGSKDLFNIKDLQFNKIIICTDADVDGYQIRMLLYTVFYRLMPELLKRGFVYVAETPLFEIVINNKQSRFAYTEAEKEQILAELAEQGIKYKRINRSKGLGENNPDMLWETTMNPETRRLVQLTIDPKDPYVKEVTQMLFGEDIKEQRGKFIFDMLETGIDNIECMTWTPHAS